MTAGTPILTIRPFTPRQLGSYLGKLASVYGDNAIDDNQLQRILQRYEQDWTFAQETEAVRPGGTIDVIGWPLLAHLAYRLLANCDPSRQIDLIQDRTMLLRCLTEYCCRYSRNPADDPGGDEARSRFEPDELRKLVQETAVAISHRGTEYISLSEFRGAMKSRISESDVARNLALATGADLEILLVNFLFKTGLEHLGCEFIHKALREFAFAEAIVDYIKQFGIRPVSHREALAREVETNQEVARLLSPRWLGAEVWDYTHDQLLWEIFRESEDIEDPPAFRRRQPALGLDPWCRIRDRFAALWGDWSNYMVGAPSETTGAASSIPFAGRINLLDVSAADARLGDALFRLCAALHGMVANLILRRSERMKLQGNMWEDCGVAATDTPHQTTLHESPDERLRFFSPSKIGEETDSSAPSTLRSALARINSSRVDLADELPEKCDLTFLVLIGMPLERFCFRHCNLSHCNLSESDPSGSDLQGVEMTNAWLMKTNLARVNLAMADLSYSCFRQANLAGAVLREANLKHADFRGAKGLATSEILQAENWESALFDPDERTKLESEAVNAPSRGANRLHSS